ncbi:ChrR Cupin-like domain-containing protein [Quadrisphaera granulorum]|uniref:ChrR-like protein with cupin domain n=1 Tax=Quadrisphaera granulorum TaxID=317664 RepID=A0A316AA50_9ACTN|nr:cupin domain-containing protein [Quadrisphaera granulorum]PWJ53880.1 ChrR-like protein with cupin domain [Quadrisphaera granulorum]SZE96637.1 ChrR Cupin-like domain-containing protein [Quadrisphaera granulorum]
MSENPRNTHPDPSAAPLVTRAPGPQAWEESDVAGFTTAALHTDASSGESTMLMKVAPGAYAGSHAHDDVEHIYILSGSFSDDWGTYGPGDYVRREPGTMHAAWSDEGATVLLHYRGH